MNLGRTRAKIDHPALGEVVIYPVGMLSDLQRRRFRVATRRLLEMIRDGRWRALKNAFNGYLAEPSQWPSGLRRCGSGWTHGRALASLEHYARKAGVL